MKKLLIVDDDTDLCLLLNLFLSRKGYNVTEVYNCTQAWNHIEYNQPDLVLCDLWLGDMDGISLMKKVKELLPDIPFIFITAYDDIKTSINAIRAGALEYVTKPLLPEEILKIIERAFDKTNILKKILPALKGNIKEPPEFIFGETAFYNKLLKQVTLLAPTNCSVIIHGESGTGKKAIAREIHSRGKRCGKPFVVFNCNTLPSTAGAKETALFGNDTCSSAAVNDCIAAANTGTLFIHEITDLPVSMQLHLLKCINEKKIQKAGCIGDTELDIRFLVTSSENLWHATRSGKLVEELYLRLNDFTIEVLPLRNRKDDILFFADYFLTVANKELNKNINGFTPDVANIFKNYVWHDNLRELKNIINKAVLLTQSDCIDAQSLPAAIYQAAKNESPLNN